MKRSESIFIEEEVDCCEKMRKIEKLREKA